MSAGIVADAKVGCDWPGCHVVMFASEFALRNHTIDELREALGEKGWKTEVHAAQAHPKARMQAPGHELLDFCPGHVEEGTQWTR